MKTITILMASLFTLSIQANIISTELDSKVVKHEIDVATLTESCLEDLEARSWGFICRTETAESAFQTPFQTLLPISNRFYKQELKSPFQKISFQFSGLLKKTLNPKSKYTSIFSISLENNSSTDAPTLEAAKQSIRTVLNQASPELYTYYLVIK